MNGKVHNAIAKWSRNAAPISPNWRLVSISICLAMIEELRAEGSRNSLTILCVNDGDGPAQAVVCNGHWTRASSGLNYQDERFEGETLFQALQMAVAVRRERAA